MSSQTFYNQIFELMNIQSARRWNYDNLQYKILYRGKKRFSITSFNFKVFFRTLNPFRCLSCVLYFLSKILGPEITLKWTKFFHSNKFDVFKAWIIATIILKVVLGIDPKDWQFLNHSGIVEIILLENLVIPWMLCILQPVS